MATLDSDELELPTIGTVLTALKGLPDDEARQRVLEYVAARLGLVAVASKRQSTGQMELDETETAQEAMDAAVSQTTFVTFAELFDAAGPKTTAERALVAGYWLQVCQGADSFSGQAANTDLKHLGQAVANITTAVDTLKNQKPALALQLKKSGKSQQARKSYKLTVAGVKAVEAMLNG